MSGEDSYSLYLHIPFCRHKCSYCDFNTYAGQDALISAYVRALAREAALLADAAGQRLPVRTVFFGGGTPSVLSVKELESLLIALHSHYNFFPDLEITLEANPGTVSRAVLADLKSLGVNRLSLGMQSAHPLELRLMERQHGYKDVIDSVAWARRVGFDNLSMDLIFGLPHQTMANWRRSLDLAVDLKPDHLSLYALTVEQGTPMGSWVGRGLLPTPDPDLAADMYSWSRARLDRAGYHQYEISNWAGVDSAGQVRTCRHNLQYWRNLPYLGMGAGAHGFAGGIRTANEISPHAYIQKCLQGMPGDFPLTPATVEAHPVDRYTEMQETMMMGLRLTEEGVSSSAFEARFGEPMESVFGEEIDALIDSGLLAWTGGDGLRLTERGHLLGNQVFLQFV
jgi:oxygen-independent coproporphyrinogen-3 oxidase